MQRNMGLIFLVGELGSYMTHGIAKEKRDQGSYQKHISIARNQGLNIREKVNRILTAASQKRKGRLRRKPGKAVFGLPVLLNSEISRRGRTLFLLSTLQSIHWKKPRKELYSVF